MKICQVYHCALFAVIALSILPMQSASRVSNQNRPQKINRKIGKTKKTLTSRSITNHNDTKDKKVRVLKSLRSHCIDKKMDAVDGLCNNTINYPTDIVQRQVKNMKKEFKHFLGVAVRPYTPSNSFMTRSFLDEEDNMCHTRTLTYFPKLARNTNEEWRSIVQDENFSQQVTLTKCLNEYKECSMSEAIPYKTICKHQMITVRLVALDEKLKWIVEDFPIPGGCACFVKIR